MPENTEPILTYFYNVNDANRKELRTIGLTISGVQYSIYKDFKRTQLIGYLVYHNISTTINEFNTYTGSANLTLLDKNDIINFTSNSSSNHDNGKFKPNQTIFHKIIEGYGKYAFLEGYVVNNTFENGDRICYVYATN